MKVYMWVCSHISDVWIVLWDGEKNTYWDDDMRPSGGYKKMKNRFDKVTKSKYIYVGEL